jgi:ABC-type multidrug transport system fused ATPase/permease subunit
MEIEKKIDHAWKLFNNNQDMIKFSDSKLRFLAVISGVLTSYILANFSTLFSLHWYGKLALLAFSVSFLFFVIFALLSSFPRFASKTGGQVPKLIYYKHISERVEANDFIHDFLSSSEEDQLKDILYQVYEISGIATKKFNYYNKSWYAIGCQVLTFSILLIMQSFLQN